MSERRSLSRACVFHGLVESSRACMHGVHAIALSREWMNAYRPWLVQREPQWSGKLTQL